MRRLGGDRLVVATHNPGKLAEMADLLAPWGIAVVGAGELGLPEPEETESTYVGNARIKAHAAARATGLPCLADDSGIEVDGLDGAPGVRTADWAVTPDGSRNFVMAMRRTWAELERRRTPEPRTARFRATLVLAWPDGHDVVFEGISEGCLVWPMRGEGGHGYDPMFVPAGQDRTFAEMSAEEKGRLSHRADALRKFTAVMLGNGE
ncbi:MAG: non-canonical purine NTP pyrophosphatase [Pseudomonadota bacterium]